MVGQLANLSAIMQAEEAYRKQRTKLVDHFLAVKRYTFFKRNYRKKTLQKRRQNQVKPGRTSLWWENIQHGIACVEEFKDNFRMQKVNFNRLCTELHPHIAKKDTMMRNAVDMETQVAITLYYLSDEGRLRKTASAFGLARSTVSLIVRRVTRAISTYLGRSILCCLSLRMMYLIYRRTLSTAMAFLSVLVQWMEPILTLSNLKKTH